MKKGDLEKISEMVAEEGYVEWSLVGFTPNGDYRIFSFFTDPMVLPVFRFILISMIQKLDEYLDGAEDGASRYVHTGQC